MKKLSTEITTKKGEIKIITVEVDDMYADWLVTQPQEIYHDAVMFEYRTSCTERKETRYVQSLDASMDRIFVSRVEFEHNEEEHNLCSAFCADRTFFTAVTEGDSFSQEKTRACVKMLQAMASDEKNYYCSEHKYYLGDDHLSTSDFCLENFKCFLDIVKKETEKGDDRPIYIFDFLERLDEAVDISPFLAALASLERQVFLSVKTAYADKYLYDKVDCDKVQIVKFDVNMDLVFKSKREDEE